MKKGKLLCDNDFFTLAQVFHSAIYSFNKMGDKDSAEKAKKLQVHLDRILLNGEPA